MIITPGLEETDGQRSSSGNMSTWVLVRLWSVALTKKAGTVWRRDQVGMGWRWSPGLF